MSQKTRTYHRSWCNSKPKQKAIRSTFSTVSFFANLKTLSIKTSSAWLWKSGKWRWIGFIWQRSFFESENKLKFFQSRLNNGKQKHIFLIIFCFWLQPQVTKTENTKTSNNSVTWNAGAQVLTESKKTPLILSKNVLISSASCGIPGLTTSQSIIVVFF